MQILSIAFLKAVAEANGMWYNETMLERMTEKEVASLLKYNGKNIILAKNLRKNATKQENHLWYDFLRNYEIKFQRQKAIGNFIVDFYSHQANLAIEIDGSQHRTEEGLQKDQFRTEILEGYGIKIIRFSNQQIDDYFVGVCEYIDTVVKEQIGM